MKSIGFSQVLKRRFKKAMQNMKNKLQFKVSDIEGVYDYIIDDDT